MKQRSTTFGLMLASIAGIVSLYIIFELVS